MNAAFSALLLVFLFTGCGTIDEYWDKAQAAERRSRYQTAIAHYTKAIKISTDPWDQARSYQYRGRIYQKTEAYEKALDDFSMVISLGENEGYIDRGDLYALIGNHEAAARDYSSYIDLDKNNPAGYIHRGSEYLQMSVFDKAKEDYDRALAIINETSRNNPVMAGTAYEAWKNLVIKYRSAFNAEPAMDAQAKLVINSGAAGNLAVTRFDGLYVNWENSTLSVSEGEHTITVQNKRPDSKADFLVAGNVFTRTLTAGHVYKIWVEREDEGTVKFLFDDITEQEILGRP